MYRFAIFALVFLVVSCSKDTTQPHQQITVDSANNQDKERLVQSEVKIGVLEQRIMRMEKMMQDMSSELRELKQQTNNSKTVSVPLQKLPALPALPGTTMNWTQEQKTTGKNVIKKFKESEIFSGQPLGKWIGKKFPFSRLIDSSGSILEMEQYRGKKLLLVILRGFAGSVCLVCSSQTVALTEKAQEFQKRNTEIVLIYPGKADTVSGFLESVSNLDEDFSPSLNIALDVDLTMVNTLDLKANLAKPTSIILDERGIIRYMYVGKNAADRPPLKVLIKTIESL